MGRWWVHAWWVHPVALLSIDAPTEYSVCLKRYALLGPVSPDSRFRKVGIETELETVLPRGVCAHRW